MAISAEIKGRPYTAGLVAAMYGLRFMMRAKVAVLEECINGYGCTADGIFDAHERIERTLDDKADK